MLLPIAKLIVSPSMLISSPDRGFRPIRINGHVVGPKDLFRINLIRWMVYRISPRICQEIEGFPDIGKVTGETDSRGCPLDIDGDGVHDYLDRCPPVHLKGYLLRWGGDSVSG